MCYHVSFQKWADQVDEDIFFVFLSVRHGHLALCPETACFGRDQLWRWQHGASTAWWFRSGRANRSTTDLSAPLESRTTCQELLTRLPERKQSTGGTRVSTPTPRGMAGRSGNQAGRASLLGEASQKESFVELPGAWIRGRKRGYWLREQIKHAVCWKSKVFVESPINV